jgi:ferredoxin-thioredoxin reductase catalytic subunit
VSADIPRLREMLRQMQEPQGYYFNADDAVTTELLEGLVANREIGRAHV